MFEWVPEVTQRTAVITRLVRNCALGRMIQYSRDSVIEPKVAAYWAPAFAEDDE
jgi:hypothetical protein